MEPRINEFIEDELDNQFPKGDKARGRALVLVAVAQQEIDKLDNELNDLQGAYDIAIQEINKLRKKLKLDTLGGENESN